MPNIASTLLGNIGNTCKEIMLPLLWLQQEEAYLKAKVKPTTIKIELRRDLFVLMSSYEHEYTPFEGDSEGSMVREYLHWKGFFIKYIMFRPSTSLTQKISGTEQLLVSKALSQWQMIKKQLIVGNNPPTNEMFDHALE